MNKREFKDCVPQKIGKSDGSVIRVTVEDFDTSHDKAKVELRDSNNTVWETWESNQKGNTWKGAWRGDVFLHYHGGGSDRSNLQWEMD